MPQVTMPKVYLAARYSRHVELRGYAEQLRDLGFIVTCRWIEGGHEMRDGASDAEQEATRQRFATEDYQDLMAADIVISFTEGPGSKYARGGRHVEFGMAYQARKVCIVVGYRENVFHHMPGVHFYPDWHGTLQMMSDAADMRAQAGAVMLQGRLSPPPTPG